MSLKGIAQPEKSMKFESNEEKKEVKNMVEKKQMKLKGDLGMI